MIKKTVTNTDKEKKRPVSTGRARGGEARAEKLSKERRSEIAKKGAESRWGYRSINKGNYKEVFGVDVDVYILDDELNTPVITNSGMAAALGMRPTSSVERLIGSVEKIVDAKNMPVDHFFEIRGKLKKNIKFQVVTVFSESGQTQSDAYGNDVSTLIDICNAVIAASDTLPKRYSHIVRNAQIIVGASAKGGIHALSYALAGFSPTVQQVIDAFRAYVREEAKKYAQEFPNELYAEWQRLYDITPPARGKNWKEKHLTVDHIYYPLAKSDGRLLELLRSAKSSDGDRNKKLFQFLNEVGARALRMHIGRILEMAESSKSKEEYEAKITERFGRQLTLDMPK